MPIIRCPHCDDRVEIEDDWYGRRIACPSCDRQFTPRRGDRDDRGESPGGSGSGAPRTRGRSDDRDDDRDSRDRKYRPGRDDDRPRRRRGRYDDDPPKKGNGVLWLVLALVGVFVILPVVGCIGFVAWGMNAKQSFDGPWTDNSVGSPSAVTASFPQPPTSRFLSVDGSTDGEAMVYHHSQDTDSLLDATFVIGYYDFPAGGGNPLDRHFADIRRDMQDEFVQPFGAPTIQSESSAPQYGYPAKEVVWSEEDRGFTLRVMHLNDRPANQPARLVVVLAGGTNLKPGDKQKFLNSVRIGKK